jgi:hypothetical protein
MSESCDNCRYFWSDGYYHTEEQCTGHCRRYPPSIVNRDDGSLFPDILSGDWCGEWTAKQRESRSFFVPPTLDDVVKYCVSRKNTIDAQEFIDFYTANGWKVGKNPMKSWEASVRTWEKYKAKKGFKTTITTADIVRQAERVSLT